MVLAESQLAAILGIAEDAVIIVDTRQRIRFFNQRAERVFGYSSGELTREPPETLLPADARATDRPLCRQLTQLEAGRETNGRARAAPEACPELATAWRAWARNGASRRPPQ